MAQLARGALRANCGYKNPSYLLIKREMSVAAEQVASYRGRFLIASLSLVVLLTSSILLVQASSVQSNSMDSRLVQQVIKKPFQQARSKQKRHQEQSSSLLIQASNKTRSASSQEMPIDSFKRTSASNSTSRAPKRFRTAAAEFHLQTMGTNPGSSMANLDLNNNNAAIDERKNISRRQQASDLNNNLIPSLGQQELASRRDISSVNGTIDLSEYAQSDLDRLYGDALLVYLKNFNDTLPARRETIRVNGTVGQVPIYRSESRVVR